LIVGNKVELPFLSVLVVVQNRVTENTSVLQAASKDEGRDTILVSSSHRYIESLIIERDKYRENLSPYTSIIHKFGLNVKKYFQ
jgi:hypothetical protein